MNINLRRQATLKSSVSFKGVGVHSGLPVVMKVKPAPEDFGIVFRRVDINDGTNSFVKVSLDTAVAPVLCTKIVNKSGVSVSVIEHLMGALRIVGITNAIIEIDNAEVPIMDGSAKEFVEAFCKAGILHQQSFVQAIKIKKPISVESAAGRITITPSKTCTIDVKVDYDRINSVVKSNNKYKFDIGSKALHVAEARTFGWIEDYDKIKELGMARGSSEKNTIVIMEDDSVQAAGGLRDPRELVMHKCLDLLGDMAILGQDIVGNIESVNPSHSLNNEAMKKVLEEISTHEIIDEDYVNYDYQIRSIALG